MTPHDNYYLVDVTWASGATTSSIVDLGGYVRGAIHLPAAFTGVTLTLVAAPIKAGTYQAVTGVSVTVAQGEVALLPESVLAGLRWVKFVASAQAAARTAQLALST